QGWNSNLTVTSGTLTNTGTFAVNAGTGGGRAVTANLTNNGTVSLNTSTTFAKTGGVTTNTSTFTVAAGQTLTLGGGSGQSFNQSGGTLTVARAPRMPGGTVALNNRAVAAGGRFPVTPPPGTPGGLHLHPGHWTRQ